MKALLASVALLATLAYAAQEQVMGVPPKELKDLAWMMGDFSAEMTMWEPGKTEGTQIKGTISTFESMNGMWIESRHEGEFGGMPMKGLQLTSYDAEKKEYMAFWFDSMGPGGLEMRGKLKGQTLILASKPTSFPGMPGPMAFRATTSLKAKGKYLFRMEMDMGQGWFKMLEGYFTRQ